MKRLLSLLLTGVLSVSMLVGCGSSESESEDKVYSIGIAQFAEHGSLDNCVDGFKEGMKEAGFIEGENVTYDLQNAQADTSIANQIAQNLVANKSDLICAVATPMAQAAYNAADGKIPVIYTAVTDPVAAQLANEDGSSVGNATGTSDKLAVDAQLQMIRDFMPDAEKIGILYTTSEANSVSAIEEYEELAPKYDFEIVKKGISQQSDIPLAAAGLVTEVDCLSNLTDNTVVAALPTVLDAANSANIPVFGSEIEQVKNGCAATEGLDYVALGKQTGAMAAKVLNGEDISNIPFETITEYSLYVNSDALASLGLEVPEDLKDKAVEAE